MSIFSRCTLTRRGRNLIAKAQTGRTAVHFTAARVGDGVWNQNEELQEATALKNICREYAFSSIDIPDGNQANVTMEVVLHNRGQTELFYVMEMGIYATDPDLGEILYAILAADNQHIYLPEENGVGISQIVERVNLEVVNAALVTIDSTGAVVSATDFLELRRLVERIRGGLTGGTAGQILEKLTDSDYDAGWTDKEQPVITAPVVRFPATGKANALYIDEDSSEFYIWKDGKYFKLPVGSEASATLQRQITENKNAITNVNSTITNLEKRYTETDITVSADRWTEGQEDGVAVYTYEAAVNGMTAETDAQVWPRIISSAAAGVVDEQKAIAVFWGNGRSFSGSGKLILKCYRKKPAHDFGITLVGT